MNEENSNFEVWEISPDIAKEWLAKHNNYRKTNLHRVRAYAEEMRKGEWKIGAPIIFDEEGILIDGQHRLEAVIRYGRTVKFIVLCGVPNESVQIIDNNLPRTTTQNIKNLDSSAPHNAAKILNSVLTAPYDSTRVILFSKLKREYNKYKTEIDTVALWFSTSRRGISISPVCAAFVRALLHHPEREEDLCFLAKSLYTFDFNDCLNGRVLAKYLTAADAKKIKYERKDQYMKTARAIQCELQGVQISAIFAPKKDPFPLL